MLKIMMFRSVHPPRVFWLLLGVTVFIAAFVAAALFATKHSNYSTIHNRSLPNTHQVIVDDAISIETPSCPFEYLVKTGDTLLFISQQYHVSVEMLMEANDIYPYSGDDFGVGYLTIPCPDQ